MMMGLERETAVFLYAVLTGVSAKAVYDGLYLLRKLFSHPGWLVGAEDIIYWICMSIFIFRAMFFTTYGSVRWFFVLGIVCGAFLTVFLRRGGKKVLDKINKRH